MTLFCMKETSMDGMGKPRLLPGTCNPLSLHSVSVLHAAIEISDSTHTIRIKKSCLLGQLSICMFSVYCFTGAPAGAFSGAPVGAKPGSAPTVPLIVTTFTGAFTALELMVTDF